MLESARVFSAKNKVDLKAISKATGANAVSSRADIGQPTTRRAQVQ
jgi:hypothetical protein